MQRLDVPAAPNLPRATPGYNATQEEHRSNALRLFFNRLVEGLRQILGPDGGRYIQMPFGFFRVPGTQTAGATNTAYALPWEDAGGTMPAVVVQHTGYYLLTLRGNVSGAGTLTVWLTAGGVELDGTCVQVTAGGDAVQLSWVVLLQQGGLIDVKWAVSSTSIKWEGKAAGVAPTTPTTLPATLSVQFIAGE